MELVNVARFLTRHRVWVAVGCVAAILAGLLAASRSQAPAARVAIATGRVLIDQDPSLVADLKGKGEETIGIRARLLGDLLAGEEGRAVIARTAGVSPDLVGVTTPAGGPATIQVPLPQKASEFAASTRTAKPYSITVVSDDRVPVLTVNAQAPTPRAAALLVTGATAGLNALISARTVDPRHAVVATPVGTPVARFAPPAHQLSPTIIAPAAALAIFLAWCLGMVVVAGLARGLRRTVVEPAGS